MNKNIKVNFKKHLFEGWTVEDIIAEIEPVMDMIMSGNAIQKPFKNKEELKKEIANQTPYRKIAYPDVVKYFMIKYEI